MQKLITAALATGALVAGLSSVAYANPVTLGVRDTRVGMLISTPPAPAPHESGIDRMFHPDFSQALTPEQMTIAWNAEIDRVFETPVAGGG